MRISDLSSDVCSSDLYAAFKTWDIGDIVAAEGPIFKTRKGELSIHAQSLRLLSKSLRPLPDKFHGLADQELRSRQRCVDLIMPEDTRRTFLARRQGESSQGKEGDRPCKYRWSP